MKQRAAREHKKQSDGGGNGSQKQGSQGWALWLHS